MGIQIDGIEGEQKLFKVLMNAGYEYFQADAIGYKKGKYYVFEAKHQERFTPPPFEGHGLPQKQVKARLKFQNDTNVRCVFVVFEKGTNNLFFQYLDVLEESKDFFDTKGKEPRRVYNLKNFYHKFYYNFL